MGANSMVFSAFWPQQFQSRPDDSPSHEYNFKIESHTAFLDALKTAIRTSAHSFVLRFVEINGLPALLEILRSLDIRVANSPMHSSLIQCLKALMNNSVSGASQLHRFNGSNMHGLLHNTKYCFDISPCRRAARMCSPIRRASTSSPSRWPPTT